MVHPLTTLYFLLCFTVFILLMIFHFLYEYCCKSYERRRRERIMNIVIDCMQSAEALRMDISTERLLELRQLPGIDQSIIDRYYNSGGNMMDNDGILQYAQELETPRNTTRIQ